MSTSIHALLADELGISEARAEKLLRAMMREVKNRAKRGNGVRIPDLGTFSEADGTLQFTPSDSLARAVNQEFEGLGAEDLSTAATPEDDDADESPTTLTPGFSSPLGGSSSSGADTDEFQAAGSEPDTAEFQAPEESSADTAEFQAPDDAGEADTASFEAPAESSGDSSDDAGSAASTGELYPMVDDVPEASDPEESASSEASSDTDGDATTENAPSSSGPGRTLWGTDKPSSPPAGSSSPEPDPEADAEEDEDNIWASDSPWDLSTASYDEDDETSASDAASEDAEPTSEPKPSAEAEPSGDGASADRTSAAPAPSASEPSPEAPPQAPEVNDSSGGSSAARVVVGLLVLVLLSAAGWFVLGRQGVVPAPQTVLSQLTQPGPAAMDPPSQPSTSSSNASSTPTDAASTPSTEPSGDTASAGDASDTPSPSASSSNGDSSPDATSPSVTPDTDASSATAPDRTFNRARGGFTIAVASRTQRSDAERLVDMYRDRFADTEYPVDILSATTNGTTRYRVGVGQFGSRSSARSAMQQHSGNLPDDAWPVEIQ